MDTAVKGLLSAGLLGGGIGIPLITYDQIVWKPTRQANEAYKDLFKRDRDGLIKEIKALEGIEDPEEALPKIREFCENIKTIEGKNPIGLISKQLLYICQNKTAKVRDLFPENLIEKEQDFGPALFSFKKFEAEKIQDKEESDLKDIFGQINTNKQLHDWCKAELDRHFSERGVHFVMLVREFCQIQMIDTVEKEITKKYGKSDGKITTEGDSTFEKGKNTTSLLELLNKEPNSNSISSQTSASEGGPKLKTWCEASLKEKLTGDTTASFIKHVKYACSGKNPTDMTQAT